MKWQKLNIFYRIATSAENVKSPVVVLLHGASSSSQVWNDLRTMHLIAAMGHKAIAVDLPGRFITRQLYIVLVTHLNNQFTGDCIFKQVAECHTFWICDICDIYIGVKYEVGLLCISLE